MEESNINEMTEPLKSKGKSQPRIVEKESDFYSYLSSLSFEDRTKVIDTLASSIVQDESSNISMSESLSEIDIESEKKAFIDSFENYNTKLGYTKAISTFEQWINEKGESLLKVDPMSADNFICYLKEEKSPSTARSVTAGISSFYSFLERRHKSNGIAVVRNPFRNTKERPKLEPVRKLRIPSEEDVNAILLGIEKPHFRLAFSLMIFEGFRIGCISGIKIKGDSCKIIINGKEQTCVLSEETQKVVRDFNLEGQPFAERFLGSANGTFNNAIKTEQEKLFHSGKIQEIYNPQAFRHYFAIHLFEKTKDIYLVSRKLHHASISVTERYLRLLGIIE